MFNRLMTPELQARVFEVHPELCFWGFAGHPMQEKKEHSGGMKSAAKPLLN